MPPTTEQLKNRELAVQNIEQGIPQNTGITDNAIAVDDLTGANDQPFATVQADIQPVSDITDLDTKLPDIPETPQAEKADTLVSRIEELQVGLLGETAFRAEQREEVGISALRTTKEDLASQIEGFKRQSLALENERILAVERIQQESIGRGRTRAGVAPLTAAAQRRITLRQADIASQALTASAALSAVQGRITTATRLVEEAVEKKFGVLKAEKRALIENLDLLIDSGTLTREEKKRAEAQRERQVAEQRQIAEDEQNELEVKTFAVSVASQLSQLPNGTQLIDAMFKMDNIADATAFASSLGVLAPELTQKERLQTELLEQQIISQKVGQAKTRADTAKIIADTGGISTEAAGEFAGVVDAAANLVGAERGKTSRRAITRAIVEGDYATAYKEVANNVEASLTGTVKSRFANSRNDFEVMAGMRDAIQEFADAGGDMSLLKGKTEEISRKLGILAGDPEATAIAVRLQREFQTYRNIMTGAAFTPTESRDYAIVNPRSTASIELNLATIDGALAQLENRITGTVNARISGASRLYDLANPDGLGSLDEDYELYLQITGQQEN